jgi:anti-sigma factor RsiW
MAGAGAVSCTRYEEMVILLAEGELAAEKKAELSQHLAGCERCRAFASAVQSARPDLEQLAPPDPGEAFFAAARERLWQAWQAQRAARPGLGARWLSAWERFVAALSQGRRDLAIATAGVAAAAIAAFLLWPSTMAPPGRLIEPGVAEVQAMSDEWSEAELWAEVETLSQEQLQAFSGQLVLDTGDVGLNDDKEDPEGVEGQIDSLSPEEIKALDIQINNAAREAKGA